MKELLGIVETVNKDLTSMCEKIVDLSIRKS